MLVAMGGESWENGWNYELDSCFWISKKNKKKEKEKERKKMNEKKRVIKRNWEVLIQGKELGKGMFDMRFEWRWLWITDNILCHLNALSISLVSTLLYRSISLPFALTPLQPEIKSSWFVQCICSK